jgi:DNA gyrase subunit B
MLPPENHMTDEKTNGDPSDYGSDQIRALEGIEGIRLRPEMYIGTTDTEGLHHLVYELVTNSIDEALAGHASMLSVTINADGSCTCVDDGRGIPVGPMAEHEGKSALEVVFTNIHSGGKFDRKSGYVVGTGGLHGVGIKAVNACSEWVEVEVRREGHVWTMEFAEGQLTSPLSKLGVTDQTGTKVTFKPDRTIFPDPTFSYDGIHKTLQDAAFLNPGLRIRVADERTGLSDDFHYEDGLVAYVQYINRTETPLYADILRFTGEQEIEEGTLKVDVALQHNGGYSENVRCYANGVYNADGGTHLTGLRGAVTRALNGYGTREGLFKEVTPTGEDFREGLAGVVSIQHPHPKFASNQKRKLVNTDVSSFVENVVHDGFAKFLEEHPTTAKAIIGKARKAAEAREAAKRARELVRNQKTTTTGGLPDKLRDCRSRDLNRTEVYLVEGDSAGGSADTGRDAEIQAILPLRGKILNVEKAQLVKILGNAEVANIFKAIGIPPQAEETDIAKRRYGKLVLMTDADVDGSHIRTLLLTFLFRHMRELVKERCVYIAQPPLFRVLPRSGRKNAEPRYVQTEEQMNRELLTLGLEGTRLSYLPDGDRSRERIEFDEARLRELAEALAPLDGRDSPLELLDRRGIDLKRLCTQFATEQGLLPRFRVFVGRDEFWLANKQKLDEFLQAQEAERGGELRVADQTPTPKADEEAAETPGTLQYVDLHEIRTINAVLVELREKFGLDRHVLYQPNPREGEPVYPFTATTDEDRVLRIASLRDLLPELRKEGEKGLRLTRFKGLGEMDSDELWSTSMDPESRTLIQVTMEDAAGADEMFRVLMGDAVEPRREFIEKHALEVRDLDV